MNENKNGNMLEEILVAYDRSENFVGKQADFEKILIYQRIKTELEQLKNCVIGGYEPNPHKQNALLWLDMPDLIRLDGEGAGRLARAISMADRITVTTSGGKARFAFGVEKVWKE